MTATLTDMRKKLQDELTKARAAAKERRVAMDAALEAAQTEGADLLDPASDAFEKFHEEFSKPYGEAKDAVARLEQRFSQVLDMDRDPPSPDADPQPGPQDAGRGLIGRRAVADITRKFRESDEFKRALPAIASWEPGQTLNMGPVEILTRDEAVSSIEAKTLVTGASATSGGPFVVNQFIPGLTVDRPFWPNRVTDLLFVGQTDSDTVEYVSQTSRTNAAAETAEATSGADGALAEAAAAYATNTVAVQLFGHFIPATTRILEDNAQMQSLLEGELVGGLLNRMNSQFLNGNGTSPNVEGILNVAGLQTQALGTDSRSDAIHKAITLIRTAATVNDQYPPDGVVLNAADYQDVRLEKDANGNYIYGPPGQGAAPITIWGLPVVQEAALAAGTGLVGAFQANAKLWMRRGVTLAVTDAHSDFFIREILVLKVTTRLAFKAVRGAAFCTVTGI